MSVDGRKKAFDGWKSIVGITAVLLHVLANVTYCGLGIYVLAANSAACEKTYHIRKYITFSLVFNGMSFVSFFVFSRIKCKESVRGRATALLILHLAFATWGGLTWRQMDELCKDETDRMMLGFQHATVVFNGLYFFLLCWHEVSPPEADWTVMPWFGPTSRLVDFKDPKYGKVQYVDTILHHSQTSAPTSPSPYLGNPYPVSPHQLPAPPHPMQHHAPKPLVFDPMAMDKLSKPQNHEVDVVVDGNSKAPDSSQNRFLAAP